MNEWPGLVGFVSNFNLKSRINKNIASRYHTLWEIAKVYRGYFDILVISIVLTYFSLTSASRSSYATHD